MFGGLVPSHWALDCIVHRPDLPVWFNGPKVGLGLWEAPIAAFLVEVGLLGVGAAVYLRRTRARNRWGHLGFPAFLAVLLVLQVGATFGPPPPDMTAVITSNVIGLVLLVWLWSVDRARTTRLWPIGMTSPRC